MKSIKKYIKLYGIFVKQDLKKMMEYKIDFLTGAVGFLLGQIVNIAFLWIIFSQIPNLLGWSFNEIVFIYGFSLIPKGLDHLLFDNIWQIAHFTVRRGDFDKYLTRPLDSLFYVLVEKFQVDAFGELFLGIILVCSALPVVNVQWSFLNVLLFILVIPFATLIYTAIKTATAALAFWIKRSGNITYMFYMVNDFAKYPTTIYNKTIRGIISYIIPFAFTAFYPASYFLGKGDALYNIGGTLLISTILCIIAWAIWHKGINAYESAGS